MFFVAKRKRKRKSPTKSSPSSPRRTNTPFIGDHILAMYQMIACCLMNVGFAFIASLLTGIEFTAKYKPELEKNISNRELLAQFQALNETHGYVLFGAVAVMTIFSIFFVMATWKGRRWAYVIHLILHLPSAALTILLGQADARFGSILSIVIAIYCLLRLFGSVGPKM